MIRNLLFSSSRRIVNVMNVKAQSQKPVRVATFNILAPCYYWIRWVSAAGENGYDTLWWMIRILFCHKAFCGLVFYCVIVASPPVLFIARKLLSSVRYRESCVIRQYANLSPIAYHIMQLTQNLLQLKVNAWTYECYFYLHTANTDFILRFPRFWDLLFQVLFSLCWSRNCTDYFQILTCCFHTFFVIKSQIFRVLPHPYEESKIYKMN